MERANSTKVRVSWADSTLFSLTLSDSSNIYGFF